MNTVGLFYIVIIEVFIVVLVVDCIRIATMIPGMCPQWSPPTTTQIK